MTQWCASVGVRVGGAAVAAPCVGGWHCEVLLLDKVSGILVEKKDKKGRIKNLGIVCYRIYGQ